MTPTKVSIPIRFDLNWRPDVWDYYVTEVSIPIRFDLNDEGEKGYAVEAVSIPIRFDLNLDGPDGMGGVALFPSRYGSI